MDLAGSRRRRPDDGRDAAGQHRRGGRALDRYQSTRTVARGKRPFRCGRRSTLTQPKIAMPFDTNTNPLLDFRGLPRFDAIRPVHVTPAVDALLAECRAAVAKVTDPTTSASWDSIVEPLDDAMERLGRAWGNVSHLNAVMDARRCPR